MANKPETADQLRSIFASADDAPFSYRGYWLSKRRDGRSGNWMIARYEKGSRCVVYRSCKTADISVAKQRLVEFAASRPEGEAVPPRRSSESVYFIRSATGEVKIGAARDVKSRLSQLRTMSPVPLTLLAVTDGGQPREFEYHQRFAEHRLHGEWFRPHPDILGEIERLQAVIAAGEGET